MRSGIIWLFLILATACNFHVAAQNVHLSGKVSGIATKTITISRPARSFNYDFFKEGKIKASLKNGVFSVALTIDEPEIVYISCEDSIANTFLMRPLFLDKGYALQIELSAVDAELVINTQGKGAADNQQLNIKKSPDLRKFFDGKDTLPGPVFSCILAKHFSDSSEMAGYIARYHPSPAFQNAWKYNLRYSVLNDYYGFSENYKYEIREAFARNEKAWTGLQEGLFSSVLLSNDAALISPFYLQLVRNYILRKKEQLWSSANQNRSAFLKKWYGEDTETAFDEYMNDQQNLLSQKIIEKDLKGKVKEYAYAVLLESAIQTSQIANIDKIYTDFTKAFPGGRYIAKFRPQIVQIAERKRQVLTDKIIFVKDADLLDTWEKILATVKGKTVLLDMWGTWCSPCREELKKNTVYLKNHFRNKGLDYLYIANREQGLRNKWKQLISYFQLEGYHILASEKLTEDIMKKIKGSAYPTYAIIKRDGSFELSKAGSPLDREKLIAQLEEALAK